MINLKTLIKFDNNEFVWVDFDGWNRKYGGMIWASARDPVTVSSAGCLSSAAADKLTFVTMMSAQNKNVGPTLMQIQADVLFDRETQCKMLK